MTIHIDVEAAYAMIVCLMTVGISSSPRAVPDTLAFVKTGVRRTDVAHIKSYDSNINVKLEQLYLVYSDQQLLLFYPSIKLKKSGDEKSAYLY